MGLAFGFTMFLMVTVSLLGPKISPKAFALDKKMFKVEPSVMVLIVIILLFVTALYVRFW